MKSGNTEKHLPRIESFFAVEYCDLGCEDRAELIERRFLPTISCNGNIDLVRYGIYQTVSCEFRFAHAHVRVRSQVCDVRAKRLLKCVCDVRACVRFWVCDVRSQFRTFLDKKGTILALIL